MKMFKSNFFVLFVFILSASIIFDGAVHSSNCLTDKFEEIPPILTSEYSLATFTKSIKNVVNNNQECNMLHKASHTPAVSITPSNVASKIIAFLHLFQLF